MKELEDYLNQYNNIIPDVLKKRLLDNINDKAIYASVSSDIQDETGLSFIGLDLMNFVGIEVTPKEYLMEHKQIQENMRSAAGKLVTSIKKTTHPETKAMESIEKAEKCLNLIDYNNEITAYKDEFNKEYRKIGTDGDNKNLKEIVNKALSRINVIIEQVPEWRFFGNEYKRNFTIIQYSLEIDDLEQRIKETAPNKQSSLNEVRSHCKLLEDYITKLNNLKDVSTKTEIERTGVNESLTNYEAKLHNWKGMIISLKIQEKSRFIGSFEGQLITPNDMELIRKAKIEIYEKLDELVNHNQGTPIHKKIIEYRNKMHKIYGSI
jgi:hypothetical protein